MICETSWSQMKQATATDDTAALLKFTVIGMNSRALALIRRLCNLLTCLACRFLAIVALLTQNSCISVKIERSESENS